MVIVAPFVTSEHVPSAGTGVMVVLVVVVTVVVVVVVVVVEDVDEIDDEVDEAGAEVELGNGAPVLMTSTSAHP